ncbi:hypothetical protein ECA02_34180 [Enterococcus casseliflavus]|nr:hypothetical protein ECA02_34180 [Enterococcus casseliflavus]
MARALRFSTWDSNIQLIFAFFINSMLLIMGISVFKAGSVDDLLFLDYISLYQTPL